MGQPDQVIETAKHRRVTCTCGWEREAVSEWAAKALCKLHPQLAAMGVAHVTRVEGPDPAALSGQQLTRT